MTDDGTREGQGKAEERQEETGGRVPWLVRWEGGGGSWEVSISSVSSWGWGLLEADLGFLSMILLCLHQPAYLSAQSHTTLKTRMSPPWGGIPITPSPVLIIRTFCTSPHPSNTDSIQPLCCANQETPPKAPSQHQLTFRSQAPLEQGSANIWKGPDWKYFLLQGPGCLCGNDSTLLCSIKAAWDKR